MFVLLMGPVMLALEVSIKFYTAKPEGIVKKKKADFIQMSVNYICAPFLACSKLWKQN